MTLNLQRKREGPVKIYGAFFYYFTIPIPDVPAQRMDV